MDSPPSFEKRISFLWKSCDPVVLFFSEKGFFELGETFSNRFSCGKFEVSPSSVTLLLSPFFGPLFTPSSYTVFFPPLFCKWTFPFRRIQVKPPFFLSLRPAGMILPFFFAPPLRETEEFFSSLSFPLEVFLFSRCPKAVGSLSFSGTLLHPCHPFS